MATVEDRPVTVEELMRDPDEEEQEGEASGGGASARP
jgi:hypothetical protein